MAHIRDALLTAVLSSLLLGNVGAEQPSQLLPTNDVDILYDVTLRSQQRIRERVRYLAAELLERVDGPHKSTTIFDRRRHQMTILTSTNRSFLKLDMPRQPQDPGPEAILRRGNDAIVAGLHCVDWSWTEDVEQHPLVLFPFRVAAVDRRRDLLRCKLHLGGKEGDMHAPFVFAAVERAGTISRCRSVSSPRSSRPPAWNRP
jgi:hypothetical protein